MVEVKQMSRSLGMGCVYLATSPSGMQYVGTTGRSLAARKNEHRTSGASQPFGRAIAKYGFDSIKWEVLFESDDPAKLDLVEAHEIAARGTLSPRGYNLTSGGRALFKHTDETREKIRSASLKMHSREGVKEARSAAGAAQWKDPSIRKKRVEGLLRAAKVTDRTGLGSRVWKNRSQESRDKILAALSAAVPRKAVVVEGIYYASFIEAGKALGLGEGTVRDRCQHPKYPQYQVVGELTVKPGRPVSVDGVVYRSCKAAAIELGLATETLRHRIKSKGFPATFYLDSP